MFLWLRVEQIKELDITTGHESLIIFYFKVQWQNRHVNLNFHQLKMNNKMSRLICHLLYVYVMIWRYKQIVF